MRSFKDLLDFATKKEKNRGTLWASVQDRRIIEFYYHGSYRGVEPYVLGVTRRGNADNESLICFQFSGFSDLDNPVGWKLYRVSEMEDIKVSREQFPGDRPGYDPENIDMAQVFCCVRPVKPALTDPRETSRPPGVNPPPVYMVPRPPAVKSLTHNEAMQRFHFAHASPSRSKNLKTVPVPLLKRPPQSVESKT